MMNPSRSPRAQEPIPEYTVGVSINTVDQAWEEWDKGLVNENRKGSGGLETTGE